MITRRSVLAVLASVLGMSRASAQDRMITSSGVAFLRSAKTDAELVEVVYRCPSGHEVLGACEKAEFDEAVAITEAEMYGGTYCNECHREWLKAMFPPPVYECNRPVTPKGKK